MPIKHPMRLVLIKGRHNVPETDGAVFTSAVNPLDVKGLEQTAEFVLQNCSELDLYVTGLTVALIATLNVARAQGIPVTLWHFDRDTGRYYKQNVI